VMRATLYQSNLEGMLPPLAPYTLALSSDTRVITGYTSTFGDFSFAPPVLTPGDSVTVTTSGQILRMTLPALTARLGWATKTVTGQAPPNSRLKVTLGPSYYGWEDNSQIVTATTTGAYTASFSSSFVSVYTNGSVTHFDAEGNQTILNFSAARWNVTLGSNCLSGFAETPGQTIVTLSAQETLTLTASLDGGLSLCFQRPIEPGDQLIRSTSAGVTTYSVPLVTAQHDYRRRALEGIALPHSLVQAHFGPEPYGYASLTRSVTADANGRYGMDTSDLSLVIGQNGAVVVTDAEGNTVRVGFTISGYRLYLPLAIKAP